MRLSLNHRKNEPVARVDARKTMDADAGASNRIVAARNEFANAFGDLARGKRNWQVMAFSLACLLGLVTIAYVRLASSARVVPYVVQVDRLGQVVATGLADQMKAPDQRLITSQLAQFIRAVRTVLPTQASAAEAQLIRQGYAFAGPTTAAFLNDYFGNPRNDPRVLGTEVTRQVDVTSVLRLPNSDVWRLQWIETQRSLDSAEPVEQTAWEGYTTVQIVPPVSIEGVEDNPLGLHVTSLSWTRVGSSQTPNDQQTGLAIVSDSSLSSRGAP